MIKGVRGAAAKGAEPYERLRSPGGSDGKIRTNEKKTGGEGSGKEGKGRRGMSAGAGFGRAWYRLKTSPRKRGGEIEQKGPDGQGELNIAKQLAFSVVENERKGDLRKKKRRGVTKLRR